MNDYSIALFLHIVGALGLFVALGLEWTGLWQFQSATTVEHVRAWVRISKNARRFGMAAMLTILISGAYMMTTAWGPVAWIAVSLGALILMVVLAVALSGPWMAAIGRALTTEHGSVSHTLPSLVNHPLLWISIQTRVAIALGIVFLKTSKPDLAGSLITIGVAIALGLAAALPMPRRERVHEGRPTDLLPPPALPATCQVSARRDRGDWYSSELYHPHQHIRLFECARHTDWIVGALWSEEYR